MEIFPDAAHNSLVSSSNAIGLQLEIILLVIFSAVIIILVITNVIDRRNIIARETEQKNELQNQLNIIQSMGTIYYSTYYIDVKSNTFIELNSKSNIRDLLEIPEMHRKSCMLCAISWLPRNLQIGCENLWILGP